MWEVPLSDGLLFMAEYWLSKGLELRRVPSGGNVSATKYFRGFKS